MRDMTDIPRHESYGMLSLSRVQGSANLHGSPIKAQHFVTLTISEGSQRHGLGHTWNSDGPLIAEIALSAVQFAEAITTMNHGVGVPCTLRYARDGSKLKRYEDCPPQGSEAKRTREEFRQRVADAMADMTKVKNELMDLAKGLSAKRQGEMEGKIDTFMRMFTDSAPFFMEQFEENASKVIAVAKAEITAHADLTARNTGIQVLKSGDVPMLEEGEIPEST